MEKQLSEMKSNLTSKKLDSNGSDLGNVLNNQIKNIQTQISEIEKQIAQIKSKKINKNNLKENTKSIDSFKDKNESELERIDKSKDSKVEILKGNVIDKRI